MQAVRPALSQRSVRESDLSQICAWVESPEELFFCFPKARWPLTCEQLRAILDAHSSATVILHGGEPVAFASFLRAEVYGACVLGNMVVAPDVRGLGVGQHLVEVMREQARSRYHARELRVGCFSTNVAGLLFFPRFGLEPCAVEPSLGRHGESVVLIHFRQPLLPSPRF